MWDCFVADVPRSDNGKEFLAMTLPKVEDTFVMILRDSCLLRDKIKQLVELVAGEGFDGANNELLIDEALAFTHPVNLACRYIHDLG